MEDLIGIALRASFMYVYALAIIRLSGKRGIGSLSPIDLVAVFIVGDMFDDIFWAEVPLAKGIVGMTTVAFLHLLVEYATYRSQLLSRVFSSVRSILVKGGRLDQDGLRRERVGEEDVLSQVHLVGIDDLSQVKEASFESSGHISVLREEWARPADKRDLPALRGTLANRNHAR